MASLFVLSSHETFGKENRWFWGRAIVKPVVPHQNPLVRRQSMQRPKSVFAVYKLCQGWNTKKKKKTNKQTNKRKSNSIEPDESHTTKPKAKNQPMEEVRSQKQEKKMVGKHYSSLSVP